jgi:hypothetical protein
MQWSKIKKRFEAQLADSLKGRMQVHTAEYRRNPLHIGRGWLVMDGHEIVSVEAPGFTLKIGGCQFNIPLHAHSTQELGRSIGDFLTLSIEEALASSNPLILGLALLDRRVSKAQLRKLRGRQTGPFVALALAAREYAEGLCSEPPTCPRCGISLLPLAAANAVDSPRIGANLGNKLKEER